ncbi:MAG: hypothetical protein SFW65_00690 [Alphaproteobacteria bacterium]|nr:hypothetical protein [Alphaproteobacteria bacterium]
MLIGNREMAHAPLIIQSYKSIPAKQVAKLIESIANDPRRLDLNGEIGEYDIRAEHFKAAGITADETTRQDLFNKARQLVEVIDEIGLQVFNLSKPGLNADEVKLAAIQNEVFEQRDAAANDVTIDPVNYYTHHPLIADPAHHGYKPQPLPNDWAMVTVAFPAIKTVQVEWGETRKETVNIPSTAHPSGLFFSYEDARHLQKLVYDPKVKATQLVFGYVGVEPLRETPHGEIRRGLGAFHGPKDPKDKIRKAVPTHSAPPGGSL